LFIFKTCLTTVQVRPLLAQFARKHTVKVSLVGVGLWDIAEVYY